MRTPKNQDSENEGEKERETNNTEPYAEDTPLTWIFGNHPEVKMVAALIGEGNNFLNKADFERLAGVSRPDVYDHLGSLVKNGIASETEYVGQTNMQLYQLSDTDVAQLIHDIEALLLQYKYDNIDRSEEYAVEAKDDASINDSRDIDTPYGEDTPLTWIFGNHPEAKLIAAILSERGHAVNISDWSRLAGVSRGAVYNHYEEFIENGIVNQIETDGTGNSYKMAETEATQLLLRLEEALLTNWHEQTQTDL
jgi:DNA-binding transcriptional ArsR family regulator